jgi:predicted transposase YdaD
MATLWDTVCKVFARSYPYALFRLFNIAGTFVQARATELKDINRNVDNLLEVVSSGQHMLLHIEFQSSKDATMAERLLEYNVLIRRQQNLPVLSCVLYLSPGGTVPISPLRWNVPGEPEVLTFHFKSIQVSQLLPQELIGLDSVELLTLLPLTDGGKRQEMIDYMLQTLRQHGDRELEVIGFAFATLVVRNDTTTTSWLKERFDTMEDDFGDIPLFQGIKDKAFNAGEQRGEVNASRRVIISIVEQGFPNLLTLAQQQIEMIEDPRTLQSVVVNLALASTEEQARQALLSWRG